MSAGARIPDATHPITIEPTPGRVRVTVGAVVVAESEQALTLKEASYPAVQYIPRTDVDPAVITRSDTATYCPFKGDASYYSVITAHGTVADAAWTYEEAYDAVAEIEGHLAFYPSKVTVTVVD